MAMVRRGPLKPKLLIFALGIFISIQLNAQNLSIPPYIDLFQYLKNDVKFGITNPTSFPDIRIWGWSTDGKVAYSQELYSEGSGMVHITFRVFDFISDKVLYKLDVPPDDVSIAEYYNRSAKEIKAALSQNKIVERQVDYLPFPIRKGNFVYNGNVIKTFDDNKNLKNYRVVIDRNTGKQKTIIAEDAFPGFEYDAAIAGYFLSPFGNRALIVIAKEVYVFEGTGITYVFSGCHLETGF